MEPSFLQSREWEKFQQAAGKPVFRLNSVLVIKHILPRGFSWLYIPRVAEIDDWTDFLIKLTALAQREGAIFCKVEPLTSRLYRQVEGNFKKHQPSSTLQPQTTLLLDLRPSEDRLLEQMKLKTRYNIRLAQRRGVEVIEEKDIRHFWNLVQKTSPRDRFSYHPKRYYRIMLKTLEPKVKLFSAVKDERILASAIVLFWNKTAHYLHGASDYSHRQLMAPFILHWEIIKQARARGCQWYDWWGVAVATQNPKPKTQNIIQNPKIVPLENHPWAGITRFKLGFAPQGKVVEYPLAMNLIFQPFWYRMYQILSTKS